MPGLLDAVSELGGAEPPTGPTHETPGRGPAGRGAAAHRRLHDRRATAATQHVMEAHRLGRTDPAAAEPHHDRAVRRRQAERVGGINNYNGTFVSEIDGSLTIRLGPMTMMAGPEADMQAESTFLARLGAARGYRITGTTLVSAAPIGRTR